MSWRLRVPASSANLGPGFDALGLALNLHLTCTFSLSARLSIETRGIDSACIPTDSSNLIWQTAQIVAADAMREMPPVSLAIENEIPVGKGLGSSASALTAGVVIASQLLDLNWTRRRILDEAAKIEGHPDNVAACVLGSVVAASMDSTGVTHAVRVDVPASYEVAVIVPDFALPTVEARAVLPRTYCREDVVFNVQRSALLIAALFTGSTESFSAALEDRLHQPYRAPLIPGFDEMLALRAPGLLGCSLSGAGPSVLVFFERGQEYITNLFTEVFERHGHKAITYFTDIQRHGFVLEKL
ncbi:MAG: homoserine kinase [Bryobacteraceae bacterium]